MPQKKKAYSIKASLIGKLVKSTGRTFSVVASLSNSGVNLKNLELAKFDCKSCNSEFAALKGTEPFCVICSSDQVTEVIKSSTKIENLAKADKSELAAIECSSCHTHNILTMTTAKLLDTKLHCVQCGTEIEYSLDEEVDPDVVEDLDQSSDSEDLDLNVDDEAVEELPNADIETDEETEEQDDVDFTESAEVYDEQLPEAKPDTNVDTAIETKPVSTPEVTEQEINVAAGDNGGEEVKVADNDSAADGIKISASEEEFPLMEVTSGELELSRYADKIIAMQGGIPVASLSKSNATAEHASVFHSNAFVKAIDHTIKREGASRALAAFNFDVTKVKLPVSQVIESRVAKQVTASTENLDSKLKELSADFQQCLQLAAVGLNKNYFKGKKNVLKSSLIENLEAAGLRNAEKVVAGCFTQHANDASKVLLEIANNLMGKTVEARNELAEAFGELNDIEDEDYDSDVDEESDSFESRLETAGYSVAKKPQVKELSSASNVHEIAGSLKSKFGKVF